MTTVPDALAVPSAELDTVRGLVGREIARLQRGYLADRSDAVAALARLRRGAGRDVAAIPDLWGLIDLEPLYADAWLRKDAAENAVYTSMTLWSLHQQSRGSGMHRPGVELGAAVRRLMPAGEIDEPVRKRFVRAGTSADLTVLASRLREIVLLLRREDIALDYALLADQLYHWQRPGGSDRVRRVWGRAFHAHRSTPDDNTGNDGDDSSADTTTDPKDAS
ncbi:type I-E CRISPR-associated protein Cse2/CasB [Kitasatospora sp. RB6PN24]|uniref:type I-E CRISPR-associated protein Cse2/CasB n=1 Tax=Kitasatospora humi TaxID=2893891 RepID=UPI001E5B0C45|nr:type I-E CRISPR-associated protein Cse2/CasB [Kitasatospora humi]MCC9312347.1 type I-E CRISPR-associated protein Cse2/CasB [Kitasatospora humi]